MRSLIRRSMLKSGQQFRTILEQAVGGYFEGINQTQLIAANDSAWQKEEKYLSNEIESNLPLIQIVLLFLT